MNSSSPYPCPTRPSLTIIIPHLFLFVFLMMSSNIHAASVSVTWDANNESDLAGYKIYQRKLPSTDYGSPVFSGFPSNPASPQITITNLIEGETYGFIATAFDASGNESSPTTEKQITVSSSGSGGGGSIDVWPNADTGDVGVWLMDGLTVGLDGIPGGAPMTWTIAGIGDLDGDDKADLVWRDTSTGDVAVWLGNGLTLGATGVIATAVDPAWVIKGVGDLSGDGKDDIVWRHTNGAVGVWLGNGLTLGATGMIAKKVSAAWVIKGMGDLSGDGKDDIVWRHSN